jgi:hypothetical protein
MIPLIISLTLCSIQILHPADLLITGSKAASANAPLPIFVSLS